MVQQVTLENGEVHEFPDDATPKEMEAALYSIPTSQSEQPQSMLSRAWNAMPSPYFPPAKQLIKDAISGAEKGGQGIASFLTGGYAPKVDIDQMLGNNSNRLEDKLLEGAVRYAPYAIMGGPSAIGQTLASGAAGLTQTEPGEQNLFGLLPNGRLGGAIQGLATGALPPALGRALEAMRPSNFLRGNLSPEELQDNLRVADQTSAGLGDVIGSPFLKRLQENILSKMPLSGATDKLQQAGQQVHSQGEDLLAGMLGNNDPENTNQHIFDTLVDMHNQHRATKNAMYDNVNNLADQSELKLELPNFAKTAKEYSDAIADTNILKTEPQMRSLFAKLQNYKNPVQTTTTQGALVDANSQPLLNETQNSYPTLKEANILKGALSGYAKKSGYSPLPADRNMANVFRNLSSSLKQDIQNSIDQSGNEDLKNAYQDAEDNYKQNYSKFLDNKIYPFLTGQKDSDTLVSSFIKTGATADRANLLSTLSRLLPHTQQGTLGYSYFSRALDNEGNLNPGKLSTLIKKLGKNQFSALVPDDAQRAALTDYSKLYGMNTKGVNIMHNAMTGQQNLDILPMLAAKLGVGAGTAAGTAAAGSLLGGIPGALAGALVGGIAPGLAARPVVNALTSPSYRQALIEAMLKKQPLPYPRRTLQTLLQAGSLGNKQ